MTAVTKSDVKAIIKTALLDAYEKSQAVIDNDLRRLKLIRDLTETLHMSLPINLTSRVSVSEVRGDVHDVYVSVSVIGAKTQIIECSLSEAKQ